MEFEDPAEAVEAAAPIVKAQVSCALRADEPAAPETQRALQEFAEPRFLHQTRCATGARWDDLAEALAAEEAHGPNDRPHGPNDRPYDPNGPYGPWRVHFHVPLHAEARPPLEQPTK